VEHIGIQSFWNHSPPPPCCPPASRDLPTPDSKFQTKSFPTGVPSKQLSAILIYLPPFPLFDRALSHFSFFGLEQKRPIYSSWLLYHGSAFFARFFVPFPPWNPLLLCAAMHAHSDLSRFPLAFQSNGQASQGVFITRLRLVFFLPLQPNSPKRLPVCAFPMSNQPVFPIDRSPWSHHPGNPSGSLREAAFFFPPSPRFN